MAWAIINSVGSICVQKFKSSINGEELKPVGSWPAFMKDTSRKDTVKCKLEYLPVIPFPPGDNIVKYYLDMIKDLAEELGLDHIFVHADEAINSKINVILWMHKCKYNKVIPLLGSFHTSLVYLKILYKKYGCLRLQDWWVDAGAIADGSVMQSIEGNHYARGIRMHKQSFCVLLKCKLQENPPMEDYLIEEIAALCLKTTAEALENLIQLDIFKSYCEALLKVGRGAQARMIIEYIKDVSKMLSLIYTVRENSIELHLAAERAMLPKCFAFDHPNYCRYLTAQHVNLSALSTQKSETWEDLLANDFGGSMSGELFSTIHGDLITETTINREVKVRGGPMRGGYSTSEENTDAFIKTSHIMATVRSKLKEKLAYVTSSAHKEITPGSRIQHDNVVKDLINQLREYFNPFIEAPARHFKTGVEIEPDVIKGLLNSQDLGKLQ